MSKPLPHHPTYNIHLSKEELHEIIACVCPNEKLLGINKLESGKAYNNSVYFLDLSSRQLVLKLSGQFFGVYKVQNEVGVLSLLKELPVPHVVAWSEKGEDIKCDDGRYFELSAKEGECGWVLMTRMPGRILTVEDLDGPDGKQILSELASLMRDWRIEGSQIGHLDGSGEVRGIFNGLDRSPHAFNSTKEYYRFLTQRQYDELLKSKVLKPLRERLDIAKFVEEVDQLPCLQGNIRLTHFDFAPRNILVQDGHVSAMLDWEFAGFMPWQDEYLNAGIRQASDWEDRHFKVLLRELRKVCDDVPEDFKKGERVTDCSPEQARFLQLCVLVEVIDAIAPWFIFEGAMEKEEFDAAIDKAAKTVINGVKELRRFMV